MSKNSELPTPPVVRAMRPSPDSAVRIPISSDADIVKARQEGRKLAADLGFQFTELALIATAISEVARNIVRFAQRGEIAIRLVTNSTRRGIEIVAQDDGPGIHNLEQALQGRKTRLTR